MFFRLSLELISRTWIFSPFTFGISYICFFFAWGRPCLLTYTHTFRSELLLIIIHNWIVALHMGEAAKAWISTFFHVAFCICENHNDSEWRNKVLNNAFPKKNYDEKSLPQNPKSHWHEKFQLNIGRLPS